MEQYDQTVIEELDEPEDPESRASRWLGKRTGRLDLLLGLALLLVLVGVIVWQWLYNQYRSDSYRAGQQYVQEHKWEAARSAFLAADGIYDTKQRLADVESTISRRDHTYADAVAEAARGEWAAALRDWRSVSDIEPGFRDSEEMSFTAEQHVYTAALSGTVAMRPSAWPPGLYWYTADGWTWLLGSDTSSIVRGSGSPCCVVYDVPAPNAPTGQRSDAESASARNNQQDALQSAGRRLMVARNIGSGLLFEPLQPDPRSFDRLVWGESGITTFTNKRETEGIIDQRLGRVSILYPGFRLSYQRYGSDTGTPLRVPSAPSALLAVMPDGAGEVVGDYTRAVGTAPQTSLYLSSAFGTGGDRLLVAVRPAVVQAVFPSPDNHYLLVDEFSPLPSSAGAPQEEHRLVVVSLDHGRTALAARAQAPQPSYLDTNWYSVSFIGSGIHKGKALIRGNSTRDGELRLIDPAHPEQPLWSAQPAPGTSRVAATPLDTGLLIAFSDRDGQDLGAVYVDAGGRSESLSLVTPPWQSIGEAWQMGDRLIYTLVDGGGYGGSAAYSVRSVELPSLSPAPRQQPGSASASTRVLYQDSYHRDLQPAGYGQRYWAAGTGLLAYVQNIDGQDILRATTYDGTLDLQLDDDISALYVPQGK